MANLAESQGFVKRDAAGVSDMGQEAGSGGEREQTCSNCRAWDAYDSDAGVCRRHPPQLTAGEVGCVWPETYYDDWCFDWLPNEETPP